MRPPILQPLAWLLLVLAGCGAAVPGTGGQAPPDTAPPVLTLAGDDPLFVQVGGTFVDPGASAVDRVDGPVPVQMEGRVDPQRIGRYTLTYTAADRAGNAARATRTVHVGASADGARPFLPEVDLSAADVYASGRVVRVDTTSELERAVVHADPYTTVLLEDGVYPDVHVVVPRGTHHLTLKVENRHGAVLEPRGKDDEAAFIFRYARSPDEAIHDLNFAGLEVRGNDGQFVKNDGGATYSVYNVYFYDLELHDLFMGLCSGLHSHDWTLDRSTLHDSRWSHFWYMMGWHHAVINSTFYNGSHDDLAVRGYYPDGEKHTYIPDPDDPERHGNVYVRDRHGRRGFLPPDDWTHLIANNRFLGWDLSNPQRSRWNAHLAIAYGIYDGDPDCGAEKVYLPPQNVEIAFNFISNEGQPADAHTNAVLVDAWGGVNNDDLASINGVSVHDNVFEHVRDDEVFLEPGYGDPDLSSLDVYGNTVRRVGE